jgi:WD40 repeat protein
MKRFLNIFLIVLICSCKRWDTPFKRNPALELLLKEYSYNFFHPVWSPDGKHIYYLRSDEFIYYDGGEVWKINLETKTTKFLLKGPFCSFSISPSGDLLALSYESPISYKYDGGPLILMDTIGNILDTLETILPFILDVKFSLDGSKLYYYAYDTIGSQDSFGFYRINIDGSQEQLIKPDYKILDLMKKGLGFDLDINDSIIYGKIDTIAFPDYCYHPQIFYKSGNSYVIFTIYKDIRLIDLSAHKLYFPDALPYKENYFESAYFSPDGKKLIISVAPRDITHPFPGYLELWILHKIW